MEKIVLDIFDSIFHRESIHRLWDTLYVYMYIIESPLDGRSCIGFGASINGGSSTTDYTNR